jgi:hypothetical protein
LIQILCINALRATNAGVMAAKTCRVNSPQADAKRQKATSGNADTTLGVAGNRQSRPATLYRAVTLSSVMPEELGKAQSPCMLP